MTIANLITITVLKINRKIKTMTIQIKTPCASAALAFFGVVGVTFNTRTNKNVWENTLRRAGFSVRSRFSQLTKKEQTVGASRKKMVKIAENEPTIKAFIVRVERHVLVVDRNGNTIVDTDDRVRDRRKVLGLVAVF